MKILFGTLAYIIVTFPLAVLWHMKIFREKYMRWQYFGADVKPMLGLASMIVQGLVLSYGYSVLAVNHSSILFGLGYALVMGLFLWSAHVLAAMGKSSAIRHFEFFTMETIYLAIQFGLYGILISLIY
ncbi:MAG: hypothetical protein HYZ51_02100 [Candidatus Doudnabacteria bacterium]|nr:hypothetical protein [Candidatus Doudnabacteria bacterium]